MAAMYAVYHGPIGLRHIANKVHGLTQALRDSVERLGFKVVNKHFFDTLTIDISGVVKDSDVVHRASTAAGINLRQVDDKHVGVTLDESVGLLDWTALANVFASAASAGSVTVSDVSPAETHSFPSALWRTSEYLPQPVFNRHHSETEMLRYIFHLASKDLGLVHAMIPLGSCTMKLNSTSSMIPLTWPEFSNVHPFAPVDQVKGYAQVMKVGWFHTAHDRC
jgi:glycine dehydrogenase